MLNFVICDDNISIINRLSDMLTNIFNSNNINATVAFKSTNPKEILDYTFSNKVDVFIFDINLKSNMTGLDLAESIRKTNKEAYLIFSTGHLEYALMAYKLKTFDYLFKPVTSERLEDTVLRIMEDINGMPRKYIKIDAKNTLIDENEIIFIKRDAMKLIFHTKTKDYECYSSFNKMQVNLPNNFVRCHKSFIANSNKINHIDPVTGNIIFCDNSTCDIGPKYKETLLNAVNISNSL